MRVETFWMVRIFSYLVWKILFALAGIRILMIACLSFEPQALTSANIPGMVVKVTAYTRRFRKKRMV